LGELGPAFGQVKVNIKVKSGYDGSGAASFATLLGSHSGFVHTYRLSWHG
jgi:hypothetical protein